MVGVERQKVALLCVVQTDIWQGAFVRQGGSDASEIEHSSVSAIVVGGKPQHSWL